VRPELTRMKPRPTAEFLVMAEAARHYGIGRTRLFAFVRDGKLRRYRREGDRRTWLSVEELERLLRPRPEE
jgi:predicted site-specific integrase-resolvase